MFYPPRFISIASMNYVIKRKENRRIIFHLATSKTARRQNNYTVKKFWCGKILNIYTERRKVPIRWQCPFEHWIPMFEHSDVWTGGVHSIIVSCWGLVLLGVWYKAFPHRTCSGCIIPSQSSFPQPTSLSHYIQRHLS